MTEIKLDETEIRLCQWVGKERLKRNMEKAGKEVPPEMKARTKIISYGSELAVARHFNVYPDTSVEISPGVTHDLTLPTGMRIDVKWGSKENYGLLSNKNLEVTTTDAFVLTTGEFPSFIIRGWAYVSELMRPENLVTVPRGPVYILAQDQLRNIQTILAAPITR